MKADRDELPALLDDPPFRPAAYLARGGWVTMDLTTAAIDWSEIDELIRTSYCLIAPKKLAALANGLTRPELARCRCEQVSKLRRLLQGLVDPIRRGQVLGGAQPSDRGVPITQCGGATGDGERRHRRRRTTIGVGGVVRGGVVVAEADQDVGEGLLGMWIARRQAGGGAGDQRGQRALVGGVGRHPSQRTSVGEVVEQNGAGQLGAGLVQLLIGAYHGDGTCSGNIRERSPFAMPRFGFGGDAADGRFRLLVGAASIWICAIKGKIAA